MKLNKRAAKAILRDTDNAVLVLRRSGTHPHVPFTADLPGGTLDEGEDSRQALVRELHEEIGIDISHCSIELIGSKLIRRGVRFVRTDLYEVRNFPSRPKIRLSHEHDQYEWVAIKKLTHVGSFASLVDDYVSQNG